MSRISKRRFARSAFATQFFALSAIFLVAFGAPSQAREKGSRSPWGRNPFHGGDKPTQPTPQPTPDETPRSTPQPTPEPTPYPTPERTPRPTATPRPTSTPRPTPTDEELEEQRERERQQRERERLERERERRREAEAQLQRERDDAYRRAQDYQYQLDQAERERQRLRDENDANAAAAAVTRLQVWQAQQENDRLRDQQMRDQQNQQARDARNRADADAQRQTELQASQDALRDERAQLEAQRAALQTEKERLAQQQKDVQLARENAARLELLALKQEVAALRATQQQNAPVLRNTARRWPNFAPNVSGFSIGALQQLLRAQGFRLPISNRFDAPTQRAVRQFQRRQNLYGSARTDNATWEELIALNAGKAETLRIAQTLLKRSRSFTADSSLRFNGVPDPSMRSEIARFQKLHHLSPGGKLDLATWCLLFGGTLQPRF